jgi:hypothetical protein
MSSNTYDNAYQYGLDKFLGFEQPISTDPTGEGGGGGASIGVGGMKTPSQSPGYGGGGSGGDEDSTAGQDGGAGYCKIEWLIEEN